MFYIAIALFSGWFLALFGFDTLVIQSVFEILGITITKVSYYFIFGVYGMLNHIFSRCYPNYYPILQTKDKRGEKNE